MSPEGVLAELLRFFGTLGKSACGLNLQGKDRLLRFVIPGAIVFIDTSIKEMIHIINL